MQWQIKSKAPSAFLKQFPEFSSLISQLLYNRGIKTQQQIDEFFNPDYEGDLHNPFLLNGMKKAVKRIFQAIKKQENIIIYADYDADGVCSGAILFLTLQSLGAKNLQIYIPDRNKEGHGLNKEAIKKINKKKVDLMITVDCGISNLEEADLAASLGIDVVITDHHQPKDRLPKAIASIDPFQKNDKYPFKDLSGAGVTYKLACALLSEEENNSGDLLKKWLLDLVALATVADVMPIIRENRTLVKYGLGVLAQTKRIGLKELMKIAKIVPELTKSSSNGEAPLTNLNTYTLGFILAPRLNAAGRMNHANVAFNLLISKDKKEAEKLAQEINENNLVRQNLTEKIVKEAKERIDKKFSEKDTKLIFEGSADWSVGLIGLVAGKIADQYHRPTIIYQEKGSFIYGSCRGIGQLDLLKILKQADKFFDNFGGHKRAAGFRTKKKDLNKVKNILTKAVENELKDKDLTSILDIDAELCLEEINWQNYDQIQQFAPFGKSNLEPRFLIKKAEINDLKTVGKRDSHLKIDLMVFNDKLKQGKNFKAIAFNLGKWHNILNKGDLVDVVFELIINEWNGNRYLEMKIIDLRIAEQ
ncbi:MAG: single-stranded-DNA-specific exonuclease RecJ [Parcubacteria group bacterium]|nr:single-stranded-DNA-specific exonuclease RecJ [Parcubacteria group bacterium]